MTNPSPDNDWNALDLPVLTDVVDVDPPTIDVPVYDFTAELDALAQAVPADATPELVLPPELSLDDVLGDDLPAEDASLSTSQLIERLPSLDLEIDLPAELALDDVLPGLERAPQAEIAEAAAEDFDFTLQEEPAASTNDSNGLGALFARASFEPLAPAADPVPLAERASVDRLSAQLDDFDAPLDMPELPGDAFLSKAGDADVQVEVFSADSVDDEWAGTWEPPQTVEPPLLRAEDLEQAPGHEASYAADEAVALADATSLLSPVADNALPASANADTPPASAAIVTGFEALPWDVPEQPAPVAPNLAVSVDDILASLQAAPEPTSPEAAANDLSADAALAASLDLPPAAAWLPAQDGSAQVTDAALSATQPFIEQPLAAPAAISLDSLPTGVLGGGLGLAADSNALAAASLGQPAAALPGGGDWLASRSGFDASDKEVELAWARDLGAEPPLDLDQLPPPEAAVVPVIAEVIRLRRGQAVVQETTPVTPLQPPMPAPADVVTAATAAAEPASGLADDTIRIEAVSEALPLLAATPPAAQALDEDALIEALYARVLPRMKVELTLWMQDALEQQAKQLMAGVMKQLKEDFDMMLAESLRSALREALDEAAGKHGEQHD
ncbi:MAG: hypothetical protein ACK4FZ_02395 [Vogesella sp.]|uniref:hypothetical protein n=1 Tax=Vogesella sp. TaxID=1904252 RepID=UPI00391999F1